jgi:hypothetical protein
MIALLLARLDTVFREVMEAKNHGEAWGAIKSAAKLASPTRRRWRKSTAGSGWPGAGVCSSQKRR